MNISKKMNIFFDTTSLIQILSRFTMLPSEILFEIFLSLFLSGYFSELTRLKGVCREFRKIIENVVWSKRYMKHNLLRRRPQLTVLPDDECYFDMVIDDLYNGDPMRIFATNLRYKFPRNNFHFKLLSAYNREIIYAYINTGVLYVQVVAAETGKTLQTFSKSIGKEMNPDIISLECGKHYGIIRIIVLVIVADEPCVFLMSKFFSTWETSFYRLPFHVTDDVIMKVVSGRDKFYEKDVTFLLKAQESFDVEDSDPRGLVKVDEDYSVSNGEYFIVTSKKIVRPSHKRKRVIHDFKTFRGYLFLVTRLSNVNARHPYKLEIFDERNDDSDIKKSMFLRATFKDLVDAPEFFHDVMKTTMCVDVQGYGKYMFW